MILNKIFRHFKENKILDLKYIIVEIALIFAGITLAAKYNNYQNQLKDEAFLKETMIQIYSEIKNNIEFKEKEILSFTKLKKELILARNVILNKNKDSLNSNFFKGYLSELHIPFHIRNINIGYKTLQNKDISLIKNQKLRFQLIKFFEEYEISIQNINYFNKIQENNLFYLKKNIVYKDFSKNEFSTENYDFLFYDLELRNCFNLTISSFENYKFESQHFNIEPAKELIKNLEKEYPYLKEENK